MNALVFAAAVAAGGVGAGLRYLLDLAVQRLVGARVPWGILAVNLSGAFALGVLSAGVVDATGLWVLGTGLLGGYTTFSSVAVSTVLLGRERRPAALIGYAVGTFAGSVLCAVLGLGVGSLLT